MNRSDERAALLQSTALLLQYPDAEWRSRLPTIQTALGSLRPGATREELLAFTAHAQATPASALEQHYVEVIDRKRRCSLYLTWWTDGETRRRGLSLARLKTFYRDHGFILDNRELPDYLPVVLEFGAQADVDAGLALLQSHRPALELLRLALTEIGTPYAGLLTGVCALLPGVSPDDEEAARVMARSGPPGETVGLEPYGSTGAGPVPELGPTSLEPTGVRR